MKPNYRRCISCRRIASKASLLRVVRVHPSHLIQLNRGMGRSAYICPQVTCVRQAFKKQRLARSLRTNISQHIALDLQTSLMIRVTTMARRNGKTLSENCDREIKNSTGDN